MKKDRRTLSFDKNDYDLLEIVNAILLRSKDPGQTSNLFDPCLHPRGIKEMAAPKSSRIAYAMVELLGTLEKGTAQDRTLALRVMIAETLHASDQKLQRNVARVLLETMKALIRAHGDEDRQLALAHDFHKACSGKPRVIRKLLHEMPGVTLQDNPDVNLYPMPKYAEGKDDVFVGRIRRDHSQENGLNMWVVSDNLRKGAATNTVQIAELLMAFVEKTAV